MKQHIATLKRTRYESAIFNYGKVPLLMLLNEHERNENFEECQIMIEAIAFMNEHNSYFNTHPIPTRFHNGLFQDFRDSMAEFGMTGETAIGNFPYYMEDIRRDATIGTIVVIDNFNEDV
ncbi:hypothetical protein [Arcticibacter sp.]|uniref:hypothetical protein n=1 Tax=Arcticibacter sp. TaxID=1872630 RepID=UPI0038907D3C